MSGQLSYVHRGGETPLLGATVDGAFLESVRRVPDSEAVVCVPQGVRLTYAQLDGRVTEVAKGLLAMGVGRGDRVGVWSTDNVEWILLQLATARGSGRCWSTSTRRTAWPSCATRCVWRRSTTSS